MPGQPSRREPRPRRGGRGNYRELIHLLNRRYHLAWERAEISVREACERLGSSVAYTTVMTTMDRLFKKGLLDRRKVGRAFVYRARATRQELENAILSSLVDAVSDQDRALLDELERLIREKRRSLAGPPKGKRL